MFRVVGIEQDPERGPVLVIEGTTVDLDKVNRYLRSVAPQWKAKAPGGVIVALVPAL